MAITDKETRMMPMLTCLKNSIPLLADGTHCTQSGEYFKCITFHIIKHIMKKKMLHYKTMQNYQGHPHSRFHNYKTYANVAVSPMGIRRKYSTLHTQAGGNGKSGNSNNDKIIGIITGNLLGQRNDLQVANCEYNGCRCSWICDKTPVRCYCLASQPGHACART